MKKLLTMVVALSLGVAFASAQVIKSYELTESTGTYTEISGTTIFDYDDYQTLIEDGYLGEAYDYNPVIIGNGDFVVPTYPPYFQGMETIPEVNGIPIGFEFPYAGNTFTHFAVGSYGYLMLGGQKIGNIVASGAIMGGAMAKVFNQDVPNVVGCCWYNSPGMREDTEFSYASDGNTLTVQFKNAGVFMNGSSGSGPVPIDLQIRLGKDGSISIVFNNMAAMEDFGESFTVRQLPMMVGLKDADNNLLTIKGAGTDDNIQGATVNPSATQAENVYGFPTMPDGLTLTFTNPDAGGGETPAEGIKGYQVATSTGTYNQISDGTVVFNKGIYDILVEDGIQPEGGSLNAMIFGNNGAINCPMYPEAEGSIAGIPFGFSFPYAGENFTHFAISYNGYLMLGGETIGNILTGGLMGGHMGKFIFQRDVPNVFGCVDTNLVGMCDDSEVSYSIDAEGLTVQYKNWGVLQQGIGGEPAPVNMQIKLSKKGEITFVYDGWESIEEYKSQYQEVASVPVQMALKAKVGEMLSMVSSDTEDNNFVDLEINKNDPETPAEMRIYSSLPDGFTVTFSKPTTGCQAPTGITSATLDVEATSNAISVNYSQEGEADEYLILLATGAELTETPEDGVKYTEGQELGNAVVMSAGVATTAVIGELNPSTTYYVYVYPYNSYCANGPAYTSTWTAYKAVTTLPAAPLALKVTGETLTSLTLSVTQNEKQEKLIVVSSTELDRSENRAEDPVVGPLSGPYQVGDEITGGGTVVYVGGSSDEIVINNLEPSTPYYYAAYSFNDDYQYSSEFLVAAGSTVIEPPYETDFSNQRRFVVPAGWSGESTDWVGVTRKLSAGAGLPGPDEEPDWTYFLGYFLGGVSSTHKGYAEATTSPIFVDKAGYVATFLFAGEIYPENPRDPAGPLSFAAGDYLALSVSADGGTTFTEAMKYDNSNFQATYEQKEIYADLSSYVGKNVVLRLAWSSSVTSGDMSGGSQLKVYSFTINGGEAGVAEAIGNSFGVYAAGQSVVVANGGVDIDSVEVYDTTGRILAAAQTGAESAVIPVDYAGVVIVRVKAEGKTNSYKLILK